MLQFLIVIFLLGVPQQNDVVIEADRQEKEQNISRATGKVVITYQDMRIEADAATYDETTKVVTAGEHIRFTRGAEHLEADSIMINLATKEGTLIRPGTWPRGTRPRVLRRCNGSRSKRRWPLRVEERNDHDLRWSKPRVDTRPGPRGRESE